MAKSGISDGLWITFMIKFANMTYNGFNAKGTKRKSGINRNG